MNIHKNARLTPKGREQMVRRVLSGQAARDVAADFGVDPSTVHKWLRRYKSEGLDGLQDRSSRPARLHQPTPPDIVQRVVELRQQKLTGKHIARLVGLSRATISRILRSARLSKARDLEPKEPVRRYERAAPGDMIHLDIKKLGRFERPGHRVTGDRTGQSNPRSNGKKGYGWEYVHACIDDHSRIAFSQIYANEKAVSAISHLKAAVKWYKQHGITIRRVMTDNGSCYISKDFAKACRTLGLKHIRTKPYTPKTNGKAERFIQTLLREWAYARPYSTSQDRAKCLSAWHHMYNWHRPHGGINDQTPIQKAAKSVDNLLRLHIYLAPKCVINDEVANPV